MIRRSLIARLHTHQQRGRTLLARHPLIMRTALGQSLVQRQGLPALPFVPGLALEATMPFADTIDTASFVAFPVDAAPTEEPVSLPEARSRDLPEPPAAEDAPATATPIDTLRDLVNRMRGQTTPAPSSTPNPPVAAGSLSELVRQVRERTIAEQASPVQISNERAVEPEPPVAPTSVSPTPAPAPPLTAAEAIAARKRRSPSARRFEEAPNFYKSNESPSWQPAPVADEQQVTSPVEPVPAIPSGELPLAVAPFTGPVVTPPDALQPPTDTSASPSETLTTSQPDTPTVSTNTLISPAPTSAVPPIVATPSVASASPAAPVAQRTPTAQSSSTSPASVAQPLPTQAQSGAAPDADVPPVAPVAQPTALPVEPVTQPLPTQAQSGATPEANVPPVAAVVQSTPTAQRSPSVPPATPVAQRTPIQAQSSAAPDADVPPAAPVVQRTSTQVQSVAAAETDVPPATPVVQSTPTAQRSPSVPPAAPVVQRTPTQEQPSAAPDADVPPAAPVVQPAPTAQRSSSTSPAASVAQPLSTQEQPSAAPDADVPPAAPVTQPTPTAQRSSSVLPAASVVQRTPTQAQSSTAPDADMPPIAPDVPSAAPVVQRTPIAQRSSSVPSAFAIPDEPVSATGNSSAESSPTSPLLVSSASPGTAQRAATIQPDSQTEPAAPTVRPEQVLQAPSATQTAGFVGNESIGVNTPTLPIQDAALAQRNPAPSVNQSSPQPIPVAEDRELAQADPPAIQETVSRGMASTYPASETSQSFPPPSIASNQEIGPDAVQQTLSLSDPVAHGTSSLIRRVVEPAQNEAPPSVVGLTETAADVSPSPTPSVNDDDRSPTDWASRLFGKAQPPAASAPVASSNVASPLANTGASATPQSPTQISRRFVAPRAIVPQAPISPQVVASRQEPAAQGAAADLVQRIVAPGEEQQAAEAAANEAPTDASPQAWAARLFRPAPATQQPPNTASYQAPTALPGTPIVQRVAARSSATTRFVEPRVRDRSGAVTPLVSGTAFNQTTPILPPPLQRTSAPIDNVQRSAITPPTRTERDEWGGLPAPWEPLPAWVATPQTADPVPAATSTAIAGPAVPAIQRTVETVQRVEEAPAQSPESGAAQPAPNIDALSRQVYSLLKQRLAAERRRLG